MTSYYGGKKNALVYGEKMLRISYNFKLSSSELYEAPNEDVQWLIFPSESCKTSSEDNGFGGFCFISYGSQGTTKSKN